MGPNDYKTLVHVLTAALLMVYFGRSGMDALIEAINNLRGGGPRPPSHPLPTSDGALLKKRARKPKTWRL